MLKTVLLLIGLGLSAADQPSCKGSKITEGSLCSTVKDMIECEGSYASLGGGYVQCLATNGNCLSRVLCQKVSCTGNEVISNNVGANDDRLEKSAEGGYVVALANGDTVWTQNTYGHTQRSLGQAFDAATHRDWNRAWHGKCHGPDYKATPLQLQYRFKEGTRVVRSVKVWNVPGNGHHAGKIGLKYWTGSDWADVSNQSPEGFASRTYGEELSITFDAVETSKFRLDVWSHQQASSPTCVGLTEVQIIGCKLE